MKQIAHIATTGDYNDLVDSETLHPLVSFIDFSNTKPKNSASVEAVSFGFYAIFLKDDEHCDIKYGRNSYDYQQGTLVFIAPQQIVSIIEDGENYQPTGYALLFHPDLIRGTSLGQHIKDYTFFSYDVHEALHLSQQEKQMVMESFNKIGFELKQSIDKHSKKLLVANIELFLDYCTRFYERQFITRNNAYGSVVEKFDHLLNDYFQSDKPHCIGIPTVAFFASKLNLSANYFGDLIKKETGKSALEYIHLKIIDTAKELLFDTEKTISEIAYGLGYKYPQHFTRLFKQQVGCSPKEYKTLN
jgi:AraC-like DNA-binding protein